MSLAEMVTFGGSGLDRAAHLRGDPVMLRAALAKGRVLPIWRGKPLAQGDRLAWISPDDPVLNPAPTPVFLGLDNGLPCFAADLSHWVPENAPVPTSDFVDRSVQPHPALDAATGFVDLRGLMAQLTPREAELAATAKALLQWHQSHRFCAACGSPSETTQGGWQRTCPSCQTQHFPRTDPVVIMLVTQGNAVLLGRGADWPDGMFSMLAGFMEPGETVEAAVRREVAEETGVRCGSVDYLASQPWPFPTSLMIAARSQAEGRGLTLDPKELAAARWVSREELVRVFAGLHPDIRQFRVGSIAEFILRNWLADRLD